MELLLFAVAGLVLVAVFVGMLAKRRAATADEAPEDRLSDEDFRRIEFGDDV